MRPLVGRILASFPGVVADAFSPHPVETISRPFSAALGPQVSKPTFGGTGVSDCTVRATIFRSWRLQATSAILQRNNRASGLNTHALLGRCIARRGARGFSEPEMDEPGMES